MRGATVFNLPNVDEIVFQLTRPMRGATYTLAANSQLGRISTHTPHAGRDYDSNDSRESFVISTHTPHAGRDIRPFIG